jgi:ABC-type amino acid transport substrate-binding protein
MLRFARSALLVLACLSPTFAAMGGTLDAVTARGRLMVCIWPDYYSITYRSPRTQELSGIDIDMAGALAADLGVAVGFVETSFPDFMDALDGARCDVAMFGVGVTPVRAQRVDFSEPYLRSGIYAVTSRSGGTVRTWNDIDRPGVVVAVQAGTFMVDAMRTTLRAATLDVVAPPRTREQEVRAGRADVFMSDFPYTRRMLAFHDWARIVEPEAPFATTAYAYAVRKGDAAWLDRVNAFVRTVKRDGRLVEAARRHALLPIVVRD